MRQKLINKRPDVADGGDSAPDTGRIAERRAGSMEAMAVQEQGDTLAAELEKFSAGMDIKSDDLLNYAFETIKPKDALSLPSLLFNPAISADEWALGLKYHSKMLTNILLNNQFDEFGNYLKQLGTPDLAESTLAKLDYKYFLGELLQLAILIEHSTIPPYLTALYSIQDGTNLLSSQIIRSVAVEEMLHMIMVCNVMNAVDIKPSVNQPRNYPSYPMKLPLNVDFYVGLEKFSTNSIATFIAIESPSSPTVKAPKSAPVMQRTALMQQGKKSVEQVDHWQFGNLEHFLTTHVNTIGEFYDVLFFFIVVFQVLAFYKEHKRFPVSFQELEKGGIFKGDKTKQIRPDQYYGSGGKLHTVEGLLGVIDVFQEIKGQGEGADDTIFDVDPSQFEEGAELAHYFRFKEVFHEHFYINGNYEPFKDEKGMMPVTTPPVGKELPVDWNAVYPIMSNAKLEDFQPDPKIYEQGKAFNKTYKKLLDAIQKAVEGHAEELEKSILYMYALREQAVELMKQPLNGQVNAAPTFEYPID